MPTGKSSTPCSTTRSSSEQLKRKRGKYSSLLFVVIIYHNVYIRSNGCGDGLGEFNGLRIAYFEASLHYYKIRKNETPRKFGFRGVFLFVGRVALEGVVGIEHHDALDGLRRRSNCDGLCSGWSRRQRLSCYTRR